MKDGKETVELRLVQESAGLILERTLHETTRRKQSQVLAITSLQELRDFIEADPYYSRHRNDFERVYSKAAELMGRRQDNT